MKKTVCCVIFLILSVCLLVSCNKCEHEYGEWIVIKEPTCAESGKAESVCECGYMIVDDIPQLDHIFSKGVCTGCGAMADKASLPEGLYDNELTLIASWDTLIDEYHMLIETDYEMALDDNPLFQEQRPEYIFYSNSDLNKGSILVIPEGVERIGKYAFFSSRRITEVILPKSVKRIDSYAFYDCNNLISINLENVESFGEYAFGCCGTLKQIDFSESLASVECGAFAACHSLQSVIFPDSLSELGPRIFANCDRLRQVHLPLALKSVPKSCFENCTALVEVKLHEGLVSIEEAAFQECDRLSAVHMPSTLRSIGSHAFYSSSITNVYLNEGLVSIGAMAFSWCNGLEEIIIPNSVTELGNSAFDYSTRLKKVVIGNGITTIPKGFISSCWFLSDVKIGENVRTIEDEAFSYCWSLRTITLPQSLTHIGHLAFEGCDSLIEIINLSELNLRAGGSHPSEIDRYALNVHKGESGLFREGDFICYNHNGTMYLLDYLGNEENAVLPETIGGKEYIVWEKTID